MEILEEVNQLKLETLDISWVEQVWKEDFTSDKTLPSDYEEELTSDVAECFDNLTNSIISWINDEDAELLPVKEGDKIPAGKHWHSLIQHDLPHKALLSLLSSFIKDDHKQLSDEMSRRSGLAAVRCYFALISIPGGRIYNIYNELLFDQALRLFKIVMNFQKKVEHTPKRKKKQQDEISGENVYTLPPSEVKNVLIPYLIQCLEQLKFIILKSEIKLNNHLVTSLFQMMILIAKQETSSTAFVEGCEKTKTITYLANRAYNVIIQQCKSNEQEAQINNIKLLMKILMNDLVINDQIITTSNVPQIVREHMLQFLNQLIAKVGPPTFQGCKSLVQQMCIRTPEKAELRGKNVSLITELLQCFPDTLYSSCLFWIVSFCHGDSVKYRMTGIEIISKILLFYERENLDYETEEGIMLVNHKFLVSAIVSRCVDVAATVRAKSLGILAQLLTSQNFTINMIMMENFMAPYSDKNEIDEIEPTENPFFDFKEFFKNFHRLKSCPANALPGATVIMNTMESLAEDDKVFVRKNALNVIINVAKLDSKWLTKRRLNILTQSSLDTMFIIRKLIIQGLTDLLLIYSNRATLQHAWVATLIPLIGDNEEKAREKVIEVTSSVILENMVESEATTTARQVLPWKVLSIISKMGMRRLFKFVCFYWANRQKIRPEEMKIIKSHINTDNNLPAWFLLVCITEQQEITKTQFIFNYFVENVEEYCSELVTEAVYINFRTFSKDSQKELVNKIIFALEHFQVPFTLISRYIDICVANNKQHTQAWAKPAIQACERNLIKYLFSTSDIEKNNLFLVQNVMMLAETIQLNVNVISKHTIEKLMKVLDSKDSEQKASDILKAVIVILLGRLCIQDAFLAKIIVPILGNLLSHNSSNAVKINIMITFTDLCVRFTSMLEGYLGHMSMSMKDNDIRVRRVSVQLLSTLVLEDFLKLKCPLLFYFLIMLNDEDQFIRNNVISFFVNSVIPRNPKLMVQEFLQALYFYNEVDQKIDAHGRRIGPEERELFSLTKPEKLEDKRKIIQFMLSHMEDDYKFKITLIICTEILGKYCDDEVIDETASRLIQDALFTLGCNEIRLAVKHGKDDDDEIHDDNHTAQQAAAASQRIRAVLKQSYIETGVPIILKLRKRLIELKSPLIKDIFFALRGLLKQFKKEEIHELLSSDSDLAAEISFDVRTLNEEEGAEGQVSAQESNVVNSTHNQLTLEELIEECREMAIAVLKEKGVYKEMFTDGTVGIENVVMRALEHNEDRPRKKSLKSSPSPDKKKAKRKVKREKGKNN